MELKNTKNQKLAKWITGVIGIVAATMASIMPAFADATSTEIDGFVTSLGEWATYIYDKILIIAPISVVVLGAILLVIYIFSDEKDSERIKKRFIRIFIVILVIMAIPMIVKIVQSIGASFSGENTLTQIISGS